MWNGGWLSVDKPMFNTKMVRTLRMNPKLILNVIYSFFLNLFHSIRSFYRFRVFADFGSTITRGSGARLIIDRRLYLGGKYIGDMVHSKSSVRMYRDSVFHVMGRVKLGPGVGIVTGPGAMLSIGDNTYITASSVVYCANRITIGRDCAIAWNTTILDTDFHHIHYPDDTENELVKPVQIGDHVWIGCNCTVLKGVTIGDNAVIGANTLVNKNVPPNCLAVGNPMRIIREDVEWKA
jgi:acetyltransferase-like isoleucine patch superfamily enzyme